MGKSPAQQQGGWGAACRCFHQEAASNGHDGQSLQVGGQSEGPG